MSAGPGRTFGQSNAMLRAVLLAPEGQRVLRSLAFLLARLTCLPGPRKAEEQTVITDLWRCLCHGE